MQWISKHKEFVLLVVLFYIFLCFYVPKWGHSGDMWFWLGWSEHIFENGLANVYTNSNCDYMPGFLYFLKLHCLIQKSTTNIQDNLYTLKYYILVFDILTALLISIKAKTNEKQIVYFFLITLNVVFLYNTYAWCQVDSIFTFFGFLAILLAIQNKIAWSIVCICISFNFKVQAIVFFPLLFMILAYQIKNIKAIRQIVIGIIGAIIVQTIILLPFILNGTVNKVWQVLTGSVGHYQSVSLNAFNFWFLVLPINAEQMFNYSDKTLFLGFTLNQIGFFLFATSVFLACFPFIKIIIENLYKKQYQKIDINKIFIIGALIPLLFFYFNTQMHERYSHPAMVFIFLFAINRKKYFPMILFSFAYGLNMEKVLKHLALTNYETLVFHPVFISVLYLILIIYLFYQLYKKETNVVNHLNLQLND
ncbi:MAG: hypothetical protein H6553_11615 [Chitinophagales bacterium]|nr:hypothetical protein [Chitinophagales bacterium]